MTAVALQRALGISADEELAALYNSGDEASRAAALAECERLDRIHRARRAWRAGTAGHVNTEWESAAYAQYLRAEEHTRGHLLSEAGEACGRDPWPWLWMGSEETARRHSSEELCRYWDWNEPRPPGPAAYAAQHRDGITAGREATEGERGEDMLGTGIAGAVTRAAVHEGERAARAAVLAGAREKAVRARDGIAGDVPAPVRPGAAGVVAVPDAAAPATPAAKTLLLVRHPKIDGARLLNQSYRFIGGLGVWPDDHSKVAAALYAASTHGKDPKTHLPVFPYRPRLFFTSYEGGSGKTRLSKSTALLCHDPVSLIESSKAGLIGMIRKYRTVIVTELDNWVGPAGRRNSWLLGVGNAGYEPGHVHTHKESGQEVEVDLFGDMMLDGLAKVIFNTGTNLTTFVSRAIIVWVERAPEGYHAPRVTKQIRAFADDGKMRLAAWMAQEIDDGLEDDEPDMTGLPGNRPGALWEPLIMTADRAGGEWPELAREACLHLESPAGKTATTMGAIDAADAKLDEWGF